MMAGLTDLGDDFEEASDGDIDSIFADEPDADDAFNGASVAARLARIRRASLAENNERPATVQPDDELISAGGEGAAPEPVIEADDDTAVAALAAAFATGASTMAAASDALEDIEETPAVDPVDEDTLAAIAAITGNDLALDADVEAPAPSTDETPAPANADLGADHDPDTAQFATSDDGESHGDMDRLFHDTEGRLSTEETSRRRANIEHLKAAVAARAADTQLAANGSTTADFTGEADSAAEYRDDLARVMRPRRVRVDVSRRRQADEQRPAPLMLVSEQRVDADVDIDAASIMPRRVAPAEAEAAPTLRPVPAVPAPRELVAEAPLLLDDTHAVAEPELDAEAMELARPAPRKMASSLANLAQRAGQIAIGLNRTPPVDARLAENAVADVADEDTPEVAPVVADVAPDMAEAVADVEAGSSIGIDTDDADPIAALEAQLAREIDEDRDAGTAQEGGADTVDADEQVDHFARFADILAESSATEIEEVLEMGAEYLTMEANLVQFKRMQLLRLVRIATDGSISRKDAISAVETLTNDNVLEPLGDNQYRLSRSI